MPPPIVDQRPRLAVTTVGQIVKERFGIGKGMISGLPGYVDQNVAVVDDETGARFVIKLTLDASTTKTAVLRNSAIAMHLYEHIGVHVPILQPIIKPGGGDREYVTNWSAGDERWMARMYSWVDGSTIRSRLDSLDEAFWAAFGYFVGRISACLSTMTIPPNHIHRDGYLWDAIRSPPTLAARLDRVRDPGRRQLARIVLVDQYEAIVLPCLPRLRESYVHNDVNLDNVTMLGDAIVGLIDFAEALTSKSITELAIALSYALQSQEGDQAILECGRSILVGYERVMTMTDDERAVLFPLAMIRMTTSAMMGDEMIAKFPDDEYIQRWAEPSWRCLQSLHRFNELDRFSAFFN